MRSAQTLKKTNPHNKIALILHARFLMKDLKVTYNISIIFIALFFIQDSSSA